MVFRRLPGDRNADGSCTHARAFCSRLALSFSSLIRSPSSTLADEDTVLWLLPFFSRYVTVVLKRSVRKQQIFTETESDPTPSTAPVSWYVMRSIKTR